MATVIRFPRTSAGRALLKEAVAGSPSISTWLALRFDWDEEAEGLRELEEEYQRMQGAK